jgi:hypothetical protein
MVTDPIHAHYLSAEAALQKILPPLKLHVARRLVHMARKSHVLRYLRSIEQQLDSATPTLRYTYATSLECLLTAPSHLIRI